MFLLSAVAIAEFDKAMTVAKLRGARDRLRAHGLETSYLRLRALPMNHAIREFVAAHDRVYVVELNSDPQLCQLVRLEVPEYAARVIALNHSDGLPLSARWVTEAILEEEH